MPAKPKKLANPSPLRSRITCPHCGVPFPPGDILWIAEHPSLVGDDLVGKEEQQRFLPTRFDSQGNAIDVKGVTCHELACPKCHLPFPRALVELDPVFISTLGAPSSGKTYFLAAMIQQAQEAAIRYFQSNLADVDPVANEIVNSYINKLFRNSQPDELVNLDKTQQTGPQYNSVSLDQRDDVYLAKPFVYTFHPLKLQDEKLRRQVCRVVCLYDNAGEHYMPGKTASQLATQHMAHSKVLLFLFDPLQHARFRQACLGRADDPQLGKHGKNNPQDQVLTEAAKRIKNLTGLAQHAKISRPLVVVVTKYDVWHSLLSDHMQELTTLLCRIPDRRVAIDLKHLYQLSRRLRELLFQLAPDIVAAAEGFSDEVIYLPNSALGCSPEPIRLPGGKEALAVRPCNIRPRLAEMPLLYALHRVVPTLVPGIDRTGKQEAFVPVPELVAPPAVKPGPSSIPSTSARRAAPPDSTDGSHAKPASQTPRVVPLADPATPQASKVENHLKEAGS